LLPGRDLEADAGQGGGGQTVAVTGQPPEEVFACGVVPDEKDPLRMLEPFASDDKAARALDAVRAHWEEKSRSILVRTGDDGFNSWMRWVGLQPVLRRIYGCSFLPDHDYGKGGRGWRDLWQDLLSLILIEPETVRDSLLNNFAGVRIDGSNATIIGERPGEFIADRNRISRVWMDHGAWPLPTTELYIQQTGDFKFLFETAPYFRDSHLSRSARIDSEWSPEDGRALKTAAGQTHHGTVLEHLLVENLVPFFNVGEHCQWAFKNVPVLGMKNAPPICVVSCFFPPFFGGCIP
jgi:cellobiose phosphorylase